MLLRKRCRCCKKPECVIASDNFDRADTGDLSPQWRPDDLDSFNGWEIVSNRLKPGYGAFLQFNTEDPEDPSDDGIRWSADLNFGGATGRLFLEVDRVDDANYHWAVVRCYNATTATLRILKRQGGSDTALSSEVAIPGFNWNSTLRLNVCWGLQFLTDACSECVTTWQWVFDDIREEYLWVPVALTPECVSVICGSEYPDFDGTFAGQQTTTIGFPPFGEGNNTPVFGISASVNNTASVASLSLPIGGTIVALGANDVSSNARFDNVELARMTSGCPGCFTEGTCGNCETNTAPQYLLGVVQGATNDGCTNCGDNNGSYLLENSSADSPTSTECGGVGVGSGCTWRGAASTANCVIPFGLVVRIVKVDGEYFIVADHNTVVQDPSDPGAHGQVVKWAKSLGTLSSDPDCDELFEDEHVLDFVCSVVVGDETFTCDYSNSTVTVSKA